MQTLFLGLVIFFAAHTFTMFRGARQSLVDRIGVLPYRGLYSVVSLGGFVLIVMGYGDAAKVALWNPPAIMRPIALALMLPALIILMSTYMPGNIKAKLKNPMLIALKTWAFAHLLVNGDLPSMLLFGSFLAWAVIDLIAVKRTERGAVVAEPKVMFDVIAVVAGIGVYLLIVRVLHVHISGVALF